MTGDVRLLVADDIDDPLKTIDWPITLKALVLAITYLLQRAGGSGGGPGPIGLLCSRQRLNQTTAGITVIDRAVT